MYYLETDIDTDCLNVVFLKVQTSTYHFLYLLNFILNRFRISMLYISVNIGKSKTTYCCLAGFLKSKIELFLS